MGGVFLQRLPRPAGTSILRSSNPSGPPKPSHFGEGRLEKSSLEERAGKNKLHARRLEPTLPSRRSRLCTCLGIELCRTVQKNRVPWIGSAPSSSLPRAVRSSQAVCSAQ